MSTVEEEIQKYTTSEEIVEECRCYVMLWWYMSFFLYVYHCVFTLVSVVEEVVDFEEYMADADHPHGHVFCFDSAALTPDTLVFQNHPEVYMKSFRGCHSVIVMNIVLVCWHILFE